MLARGRPILVRIRARVGLLAVLPTAIAFGAGLAPAVAATSPSTTTTPTLPPVDLLAGVPWIQRAYASPCSDAAVQMVGGSAIDAGSLAVLDDVVPIEPTAGLAVAFMSCHAADGSTTQSTAVLVKAGATGAVASLAEQLLGAQARVVDLELPSFTVEAPAGTRPADSCCPPFVTRQTYTVAADGFDVAEEVQLSAFEQSVPATPLVGGDGDLVRASIPAAALCYRWNNVYLAAQDPGAEPLPAAEPSAELQTIRLALIYITGSWITPTAEMSQQMADVVAEYQESRGLSVDGIIGDETTDALSADLGCPGGGSFNQVMPPRLGPRRFPSVADLLVATQRYASTRTSGNISLDALLRAAGWDGANSLFLGCYRWDMPVTGMSCSWSGTTPLQLIGLVDDAATPGIGSFSILYARSALTG